MVCCVFILTVALLLSYFPLLSSPLLSSPLLSSHFLLCFYGNLYNPAAQFFVITTKYQRRETTLQFNLKLASAKRKSQSCKREAWCVTKLYNLYCGGSHYNSCLQDHISHDDTHKQTHKVKTLPADATTIGCVLYLTSHQARKTRFVQQLWILGMCGIWRMLTKHFRNRLLLYDCQRM